MRWVVKCKTKWMNQPSDLRMGMLCLRWTIITAVIGSLSGVGMHVWPSVSWFFLSVSVVYAIMFTIFVTCTFIYFWSYFSMKKSSE